MQDTAVFSQLDCNRSHFQKSYSCETYEWGLAGC